MPIFFDAPVAPDDLTVFIRNIPTPPELPLLAEFPTVTVDDNTVNFAEITRTNRTARFRAFDGQVHTSSRDTGSQKQLRLAPLSTHLAMGEYERLQQQFARTGGTRLEALAAAIYNDAAQLTREVQARLEQAWGDVLVDGRLSIRENGLSQDADFGVPANQVVTAGVAWTDTTNARPLTDLQAWTDIYIGNNGGARPARVKLSLSRARLVQRNAEVIAAVSGSAQGRTRVSLNEVNVLLAGEGLPVIDEPYETQVDVDGTATRVFPVDRAVLLPADLSQLGYTAWGVTATATELTRAGTPAMSFQQAPGVVGIVVKADQVPFRQYVYVDAVAMPILSNARRLMVATV